MRLSIIRPLVHKELLRHLSNRGSAVLAILMVTVVLVMSVFGGGGPFASLSVLQPPSSCTVEFADETGFIRHLRGHIPPEFAGRVAFHPLPDLTTEPGPAANCAVARVGANEAEFWRADRDAERFGGMEAWLRQEAVQFGQTAVTVRTAAPAGGMEMRNVLASALVLFALFFTCVYLLPSLTCEERERGVLLAQALSPASPWEIIAAKLVFYPAAGLLLGGVLAGLYRPDALLRPAFWLALVALAGGSLGVGLTIASLAKTQRAASLGALSYMLVVSLLILTFQQRMPGLRFLFLEYHGPQMLNAVLAGGSYSLGHLVGALALAGLWLGTAAFAFRRFGWQ
jgi:hypothetical protein